MKGAAVIASVMMLVAGSVIYPHSGVVTSVDYEQDTITVSCSKQVHEPHIIRGAEDWFVGDICSMLMFNNLTSETIADDIVLSTRCDGYIH